MSNFTLGFPKKGDKMIVGIWLRYRSNPDIIYLAKKSWNKGFFDTVVRVIISEVDDETGEVWLEFWCKNIIDILLRKHRYNVFYKKVPTNPEWICEGDLGKGYVKN
jgi:hypothetical protein